MTFDARADRPSVQGNDQEIDPVAGIIAAYGDFVKSDDAIWRLADLVLEYAGPPGPDGVHSGFKRKITALIAKLKEAYGERAELCFSWWERLRLNAHRFPPPTRIGGVAFNLHYAARDPKTLHAAAAEAKRRNVDLTEKFIAKFRARRDEKGRGQAKWIVAVAELKRAAADIDARARSLVTLLAKHKLADDDRERLKVDLGEIRTLLESTIASIDVMGAA